MVQKQVDSEFDVSEDEFQDQVWQFVMICSEECDDQIVSVDQLMRRLEEVGITVNNTHPTQNMVGYFNSKMQIFEFQCQMFNLVLSSATFFWKC